jgi:hypothetical protein
MREFMSNNFRRYIACNKLKTIRVNLRMSAYDPIDGQAEELDLLYRTYGISTTAVLGIALTGTIGCFGLTAGRMKLLPRVLLSPLIGVTSGAIEHPSLSVSHWLFSDGNILSHV